MNAADDVGAGEAENVVVALERDRVIGESRAADVTYKLLFLGFVVLGSSMQLGSVIDFSDAMIFAMAFPNILGIYFLLPVVKKELNDYWSDYRAGRLQKFGRAANRG